MFSKKSLFFCVCALSMTSLWGCDSKEDVDDEGGKTPEQVGPSENLKPVNTCTNKVKDDTETDVDCGGECGGCAAGKACVALADCERDAVCVGGKCVKDTCTGSNCQRLDLDSSCSDGVKNNDETDVDCGGSCDECLDKEACSADADCASGLCNADTRKCEGDKAKLADIDKLVINEVMSMPWKDKNFAIQKDTAENEFVEIVNLEDVPVSVDGYSLDIQQFDGDEQYDIISKSVKLRGVIPAKGVMVVSEKPIPMPEDGVNLVVLNNSLKNNAKLGIRLEYAYRDSVYGWRYKYGDYVLIDTQTSVKPGEFYKTYGKSHNRYRDLSDSLVVTLREHDKSSDKKLANSPGYCANGSTFSEGCGTTIGEKFDGRVVCHPESDIYNEGCPEDLACEGPYNMDDAYCGYGCKEDSDCPSDMYCSNVCVSHSNNMIDSDESDVDCGGDSEWHPAPRCKAGQQCFHGSDCETGTCKDNVCQATCDPKECDGVCNGDVCVECMSNSDCKWPNHPVCVDMKCEVECDESRPCADGKACLYNKCIVSECDDNNACEAGKKCDKFKCVKDENYCYVDSDCGAGMTCNVETHACEKGGSQASEPAVAGTVKLAIPDMFSLTKDYCGQFATDVVKSCVWNENKTYNLVLSNNAIVTMKPSSASNGVVVLKQPASDYYIEVTNVMAGYQVDLEWKVGFSSDKWPNNRLLVKDSTKKEGHFTPHKKDSVMKGTFVMDKTADAFVISHGDAEGSNVLSVKTITIRKARSESASCANSVCAARDDENYKADVCYEEFSEYGGDGCGCMRIDDCRDGYECSEEQYCRPIICDPVECSEEEGYMYSGNACIMSSEYGGDMFYECGCETDADCNAGYTCKYHRCSK